MGGLAKRNQRIPEFLIATALKLPTTQLAVLAAAAGVQFHPSSPHAPDLRNPSCRVGRALDHVSARIAKSPQRRVPASAPRTV